MVLFSEDHIQETRRRGRIELQQEVDAVQEISPSAVEETAEEEDEVAGSK